MKYEERSSLFSPLFFPQKPIYVGCINQPKKHSHCSDEFMNFYKGLSYYKHLNIKTAICLSQCPQCPAWLLSENASEEFLPPWPRKRIFSQQPFYLSHHLCTVTSDEWLSQSILNICLSHTECMETYKSINMSRETAYQRNKSQSFRNSGDCKLFFNCTYWTDIHVFIQWARSQFFNKHILKNVISCNVFDVHKLDPCLAPKWQRQCGSMFTFPLRWMRQ